MSTKNWHAVDRFELLASLYHKRFGRLAPGKDDVFHDSSDDENIDQHHNWLITGQCHQDLLSLTLDVLQCLSEIVRDYNNTYDADQCQETGRWHAAADVDLKTMQEAEKLVRKYAP